MDDLLMNFYKENDEVKRLELIEVILEDYKVNLNIILDNILNKKELRNNAYLLNIMSKKKKVNDYLSDNFKMEHYKVLVSDSDPKTRKNTYIFMGNFLNKNYVLELIKALKEERTNYCLSSLVLTLGNYKIKNIDEIMDKYLQVLNKRLENGEIEEVHYNEVVRSINKVINKNKEFKSHTFIGLNKEVELLLTCMKPLINSTFSDVKRIFPDARKIEQGIIIKSDNLDKVFKIRTFYEALIVNKDGMGLDLEKVMNNIVDFLNQGYLYSWHKESSAFNYRIEFVTSKNKEEKAKVYNKVNELISNEFKDKYFNNPSNYEFEIRIIDNGTNYDVFYKLYTYIDNRYKYRKKDLPASINPTSAAIMLNEVKAYLHDNANVLDPFCGTSTMLIERSYLTNCNNLSGIDINKTAIEDSIINTKEARVRVNLIHSSCLEHKGYYDEIISNMPYGNRVGTHQSNEILYKDFFNKLSSMLLDGGVAILLTGEISLVKKLLKTKTKLKIVKDIYTETGGLTPHLFVIKKV